MVRIVKIFMSCDRTYGHYTLFQIAPCAKERYPPALSLVSPTPPLKESIPSTNKTHSLLLHNTPVQLSPPPSPEKGQPPLFFVPLSCWHPDPLPESTPPTNKKDTLSCGNSTPLGPISPPPPSPLCVSTPVQNTSEKKITYSI